MFATISRGRDKDGTEDGSQKGSQVSPSKRITSRDQASKSVGRIPWHQEPKKDVISCEKPRGGANNLRSVDIRMGKPGREKVCHYNMNP